MTDTNSARWQTLGALLDELLVLGDRARRARLEELGRQDPQLRVVLENLVDAHGRFPITSGAPAGEAAHPPPSAPPPEFDSEPPAVVHGPPVTPDDEDSRLGTVVGGYRLLERLGQGGMARVYRGLHEDPAFDHEVAVKLVRPGAAMGSMPDRLREEQRILAGLSHPNIARLFSGGVGEDGQPYIIMERVDGLPLDRFCDDNRLGLEERLRLFRTICRAIEYAHGNLVVHRDLKPSNIMVSGRGEVKVLDFGVAKLLDAEDGGAPDQGTLTSLYGVPMTPGYAAPEQLEGREITTRTDVYALGVVLYELLTGYRPFELKGLGPLARSRRMLESGPTRPSHRLARKARDPAPEGRGDEPPLAEVAGQRRTTPARLRRRLQGDLDTILLKALRREPERRYGSVLELREDIERHLAHLPVRARPESWGYSLGLFLRRHRAAVTVAALAIFALLASLATAVAGQAAARREAATSERIARFLVETFRAPDPTLRTREGPVSARELLASAARRLGDELDSEPELEARMAEVLAESFLGLGELAEAEALSTESRRLWEEIRGPRAAESLAAKNLQAGIWRQMGRLEEAGALYRELISEVTGHPSLLELSATVANDYGILLTDQGEVGRAEELYRQSLRFHRRIGDLNSQDAIRTRNNLAVCRRHQGDLEEAESLLREVLEDQQRNLKTPHPDVANALNNLARVVRQKGDLEEAESLYREALAQRRAALGDTHPDVGQSYNNLGAIHYYKGDLDGAGEYFQKALDILEILFPGDHPRVSAALANLGSLRRSQGRFDEAEGFYRRAVAMDERLFGSDHVHVAQGLVRWAATRREAGRPRDAVALYERALTILEASAGTSDPATLETARDLAGVYRTAGRPEAADALLARLPPR